MNRILQENQEKPWKNKIITLALIFALLSGLLISTASAFSIRNTAPVKTNSKWYCYGDDNPYPGGFINGRYEGNCTWYAFGRAWEASGKKPNGLGVQGALYNAGQWYDKVTAYPKGSTPRVGAIACWSGGSYGHVAFVEEVESDTKITFTESNAYTYWNGTGDPVLYWRKMTCNPKTYVSNGRLLGYIYINCDIAVNSDNFPDKNFRKYVSNEFDRNGDGYLIEAEIKKARNIWCRKSGISSLKGISYFTELEYLDCSDNNLTELDLCKCKSLDVLDCEGNNLKALDISSNTELSSVNCSHNKLTSLTIGKNTSLMWLECNNNNLTELNISGATGLNRVYCHNNKLKKLSFKSKYLNSLWCFNNRLSTVDVTSSNSLNKLVQNGHRLTKSGVDIFGRASLESGETPLAIDRTVKIIAGPVISKPTATNITYKNGKYQIADNTAIFIGVKDNNEKSLTVVDSVKHGGKQYKVTKISSSACKGLKNLAKVSIGKNVKQIGKNAFCNCTKLKEVTFKGTKLKKIGDDAFKNTKEKITFKCPKLQLTPYKKLIKKAGAPSSAKYSGQ